MIANWKDKITFGKFKGYTVKFLNLHIMGAMKNTDRTNFTEEVRIAVEKRTKK